MGVIRVIYRWRVEPERQAEFAIWWHEGTLRIRASEPGAMGSTLCRSTEDPDCFVGIARWVSRDHVEAFWERTGIGALEFRGTTTESIEILEELDHLTVDTQR